MAFPPTSPQNSSTPPQPGPVPPVTPAPAPFTPAPAPQPVPASPAPAPVVPTPLPAEDDLDEKELEALSPLSMMRKNGPGPSRPMSPVPPVTPAPARFTPAPVPQPVPASPAPAAPTAVPHSGRPFILPTALPGGSTPPQPGPVPPVVPSSRPVAPVPTAPVAQPAAVKSIPEVKPSSPITEPLGAKPVPPQIASTTPVKSAQTVTKSATPRRRGSVILVATAGLLIALLLLVGGGYVLALNGARLPFLYSYVSGLEGDGLLVANKAEHFLSTKQSYQQSGEGLIKGEALTGTSLPDGGAGDVGTSTINTVKTSVTSTSPLQYDLKTEGIAGKIGLTIDAAQELPVLLNTHPTGIDSSWAFNLTANTTNPLVSVSSEEIKKNILYTAFQPMSLGEILAGVKKETAYQKLSGQSVAHYTYELDTNSLSPSLPNGASVSAATAEVYYAWNTAEPLHTQLQATLRYQSRNYQLTQTFDYGRWDTDLPGASSDTDLQAILGTPDATKIQATSATAFIPQLGVLLSAVPNTYDVTSSAEAIVPSGESIIAITSAITTIPPLPATPVAEAGKQRDTQRLTDLADLQKALEAYKTKEGSYPLVTGVAQTLSSTELFSALVPTYITKMPVDPLKDTYWYEYISDGNSFTLRSVAENAEHTEAKEGKAFSYFEVTGK